MSATVDEVADAAYVSPGDILALLAMYPDDVTDLWEESGVLSKVGIDEVHDMLDPGCVRKVPRASSTTTDKTRLV